jgi:hypothetical protein
VVSAVVIKGPVNPELMFYSEEASFTLSGYVNSQNNTGAQKILMHFMECHCMV